MPRITLNNSPLRQKTDDPGSASLLLALGAAAIAAGVTAIVVPRIAALTVEIVIGFLLVLDGVLQGFQAYQLRRRRGYEWKIYCALAAFVVGVVLLLFPLTGVITLNLIIGAFFVVSGVLKVSLAYRFRGLRGSGWLAFIGTLALLVGGVILFLWPDIAASLIGVLVGVDLILGGTWVIAVAFAAVRPDEHLDE